MKHILAVLFLASSLQAATLTVGVGKQYATPCEAVKAATTVDGDVLEIDAGTYNTTAVFCAITKALTLRGVGGRAIFDGQNQTPTAYSGQAIMPVDAKGLKTVVFENIEFVNAAGSPGNVAGVKVNPDTNVVFRNGAMRRCQNGYLASKGLQTVTFEGWEFESCGTNTGQEHNIYDSGSAHLIVRWSWSHDSRGGQLLKSRAVKTTVEYSRFDGVGNYEMDFSNGGEVVVIGSMITQVPVGSTTNNKAIINYGREGITHPINTLRIAYSTIVNEQSLARLIAAQQDPTVSCEVSNSIIQSGPGFATLQDCPTWSAPGTVTAATGIVGADYRLLSGSIAIGAAVQHALLPTRQYTLFATEPRTSVADAGAYAAGSVQPPPADSVTWTLVNGTIPPGLTLAPDGTLAGTPTQVGTYTFTIRASKPNVNPAEKQFTLTITSPVAQLIITTTSPLPSGQVGVPYSMKFAAA
jgi:ribosomal protein S11